MSPYRLDDRLVVGVASSALFDLTASDAVFRKDGEQVYRAYQEEHLQETLAPGVAFPFVQRLLSLNDLSPGDPLVEVIVMSRNDPDTGLRVMKSIQAHELPISRAVFRQGRSPHKFMPAFNMALFLSGDEAAVRDAVKDGLPAGQVLPSQASSPTDDGARDLRVAFDFDGVLADDASEGVMQEGGLEAFHEYESAKVEEPHAPGPLRPLLAAINRIQDREEEERLKDPAYRIRVHVAIVTARNAPSHERALASLKRWGVRVNDAFFLGGVDKAAVLQILQPHIFFDDQMAHLEATARVAPSVHVPFGLINTVDPTVVAEGSS